MHLFNLVKTDLSFIYRNLNQKIDKLVEKLI